MYNTFLLLYLNKSLYDYISNTNYIISHTPLLLNWIERLDNIYINRVKLLNPKFYINLNILMLVEYIPLNGKNYDL